VTGAARPATVRFYVDADVLGLAKILVTIRSDVTFPGDPGGVIHRRQRPACPITSTRTPDEIWIPETARRGWLIITRDSRIQHHRAEIRAVQTSGARMIAPAGVDAGGTWEQLETLMNQWRAIEKRLVEPGPFIYTATRTTLRPVDLTKRP
jgi:hypothetical protein